MSRCKAASSSAWPSTRSAWSEAPIDHQRPEHSRRSFGENERLPASANVPGIKNVAGQRSSRGHAPDDGGIARQPGNAVLEDGRLCAGPFVQRTGIGNPQSGMFLGPKHPVIATMLSSIGTDIRSTGDYVQVARITIRHLPFAAKHWVRIIRSRGVAHEFGAVGRRYGRLSPGTIQP